MMCGLDNFALITLCLFCNTVELLSLSALRLLEKKEGKKIKEK